MTPTTIDPRRLDVAALARQGASLDGQIALADLTRLADAAHADAPPGAGDVAPWRARGEQRPVRGGAPQTWLHLEADAALQLVCQRCLAPVAVALEVRRDFLFVEGEDAAAQLDADHEDDVLALPRWLDLIGLVEDELLLALPLVPRHERCPQPLPQPVE